MYIYVVYRENVAATAEKTESTFHEWLDKELLDYVRIEGITIRQNFYEYSSKLYPQEYSFPLYCKISADKCTSLQIFHEKVRIWESLKLFNTNN